MANACIGPCPPGQIYACTCFTKTGDTPGADTIARLYKLGEKGQIDASTPNSIIATIIAYGFTTASVTCQQSFVNQQAQIIKCNQVGQGRRVQANQNCIDCKALAQQVYDSRMQLEADAQAKNSNYTPQVLDQQLYDEYFGFDNNNDGVCKYVCEQCVLENVSQNIQMHVTAECDVGTSTWISSFVNGMSIQAENELTQRQAALKNTGLQIATQQDVKSLAFQMSDTIRQMTSLTQINGLNQWALNIQQMKIDDGSTSVAIQNATQSISLSMFASLISKTYTDTVILNSIDYQQQQKYIELDTSFSNLIDSLQSTITTMEGLLINTIGQILIIILVIVTIIALIFAAFFFYNPSLLFGGVTGNTSG